MNDSLDAQDEKYPDQYLLAYIDVLGTKERISKYKQSSDVAVILYTIKQFFTEQQKNNSPNNQQKPEAFIFSDTLVLFIKVPENAINVYLFNFCNSILHTQSVLFNMGIFCRGAITHGDFFIDTEKNIFFGPAFSRAYVLEQKFSKYPRIIVDPSIFHKDIDSRSIIGPLSLEAQIEHAASPDSWTNRITEDVDGFSYIDYFTDDAKISISKMQMLITNLSLNPTLNASDGITELSPTQLSIREKYSWVIDKLDQREKRLQPNHLNSQQS
jgi:hypothetical protein